MLLFANKAILIVMVKYVTSRVACEQLGLHANTLRKYADEGSIEIIKTPSGQRKYNVDKFLGVAGKRTLVCYCRVSSYKQKDDLQRQVEYMGDKYPHAEIVKDIGSGLNYKRKGLKALLQRAMSGESITLMVAHRDRLARFGIELITQVIESNGGTVVVLKQDSLSPEQELTADLLNILHVFSLRMHGLRNYKKQVSQALDAAKPTQ